MFQKHKIMIPPSLLLKPAPTDLYTEIWERIPYTNIKDFTDFTIYRGEIRKYNKEIWRFTRISLIYTEILRKITFNLMHSTYRLLITKELECQTNTDHCCPLKWGNTQSNYLAHILSNKYQGFNWNPWI